MEFKTTLAVFDMDGTLIDGRLIEALSKKFGLYGQVKSIQSDESISGYVKTQKIASVLRGIGEGEIAAALESIPLAKNSQEVISLLKKRGFKIGIITDSYSIAAQALVNKLDLDFFYANDLKIANGLVTGEINMPLGWDKIDCFCKNSVCKRYHMEMHAGKHGADIKNTIAVGDTKGDLCMLKQAGIGIAYMPKDKHINEIVNQIKIPDMIGILDFIE
jgi:HAD superfamily phosphoserine phosphatase-like hydrolase